MKLHTIKTGLKQDQALAFKALAAEVLQVGYDFYILYDQVRLLSSTSVHDGSLTACYAGS